MSKTTVPGGPMPETIINAECDALTSELHALADAIETGRNNPPEL